MFFRMTKDRSLVLSVRSRTISVLRRVRRYYDEFVALYPPTVTCIILATPTVGGALDAIAQFSAIASASPFFIVEVAGGVVPVGEEEQARVREALDVHLFEGGLVCHVGELHAAFTRWLKWRGNPAARTSELSFGLQSARVMPLWSNSLLWRPLRVTTSNLLATILSLRGSGMFSPAFALELTGQLPEATKGYSQISFKSGGGIITNMAPANVCDGTFKACKCSHGDGSTPCGMCLSGLGGDSLWTVVWREDVSKGEAIVVVEGALRTLTRMRIDNGTSKAPLSLLQCECGRGTCLHLGPGPCPAPQWADSAFGHVDKMGRPDTTVLWISLDDLGRDEFARVKSERGDSFIIRQGEEWFRVALVEAQLDDVKWAVIDARQSGEHFSAVIAGADTIEVLSSCRKISGIAPTAALVSGEVRRSNVLASGLAGAVNFVEMMGAAGSSRAIVDLCALARTMFSSMWVNEPCKALGRSVMIQGTSATVSPAVKRLGEACRAAGLGVQAGGDVARVWVTTSGPNLSQSHFAAGDMTITCNPATDGRWVNLFKAIGDSPVGAWIITGSAKGWTVCGEYMARTCTRTLQPSAQPTGKQATVGGPPTANAQAAARKKDSEQAGVAPSYEREGSKDKGRALPRPVGAGLGTQPRMGGRGTELGPRPNLGLVRGI